MPDYNPKEIEEKWQKEWEKSGIYHASDASNKEKYYALIEFPYPSADGLHVGHPRPYIGLDVIARKRRMQGHNVLYPIGWDAFGLPTENFAIKKGKDPRVVTKDNTDNFRRQIQSLGVSFDWSREVNTTDPAYYKWTQWLFLKFLEKGLAYKAKIPINWCPKDKIGLANEEVVNGCCERCGTPVEQREKEQWMLKITAYAERLLNDLDTVDYPERVKTQQKNWIGKSEGALIKFDDIKVFTTRPDTIFGATFIAISGKADKFTGKYVTNPATKEKIPVWEAEYVMGDYGTGAIMGVPAHDERDFEFAKKHSLPIKQVVMADYMDKDNPPREGKKDTRREVVHVILRNPKNKTVLLCFLKDEKWGEKKPVNFIIGGIEDWSSEMEAAVMETKEETGYVNIKFVEKLPVESHEVFYAAHKDVNRYVHVHPYIFDLIDEEKVEITEDQYFTKDSHEMKWIPEDEVEQFLMFNNNKAQWRYIREGGFSFGGEGVLTNSGEYNGLKTEEARTQMAEKFGTLKTTYKLRDWVFSRQRYWGEPIPVVHCEKCGYVPVPEKDLPVLLPEVKNYQPTDTGESPLANISEWVNTTCPKCGGEAKRETDTMPNWAGSSWYFLRYTDPKNDQEFASQEKLKYWTPVDWYNGGMEHTVLHLLYSRFWNKFLFDLGLVPTSEPYKKRTSHGLILAEGGEKMSKSKGNVVNPDSIVERFGADTLRLYEMFMGPFEQAIEWNESSLVGPRRFLEKVWKLQNRVSLTKSSDIPSEHGQTSFGEPDSPVTHHQTIKKVSDDVETLGFNTAVSTLMIFANDLDKRAQVSQGEYETLLKLLAPFAPHMTEELWYELGHTDSIHIADWPQYDEKKLVRDVVTIVVQVDGKVRGKFTAPTNIGEEEVVARAKALPEVAKWLGDKKVEKQIFVPQKLVNFVLT